MKSIPQILIAFAISAFTLIFTYLSLGWLVTFLFAGGYLGGLIFWLLTSQQAPFKAIRTPYWLTLVFFFGLYKPEYDYFPEWLV